MIAARKGFGQSHLLFGETSGRPMASSQDAVLHNMSLILGLPERNTAEAEALASGSRTLTLGTAELARKTAMEGPPVILPPPSVPPLHIRQPTRQEDLPFLGIVQSARNMMDSLGSSVQGFLSTTRKQPLDEAAAPASAAPAAAAAVEQSKDAAARTSPGVATETFRTELDEQKQLEEAAAAAAAAASVALAAAESAAAALAAARSSRSSSQPEPPAVVSRTAAPAPVGVVIPKLDLNNAATAIQAGHRGALARQQTRLLLSRHLEAEQAAGEASSPPAAVEPPPAAEATPPAAEDLPQAASVPPPAAVMPSPADARPPFLVQILDAPVRREMPRASQDQVAPLLPQLVSAPKREFNGRAAEQPPPPPPEQAQEAGRYDDPQPPQLTLAQPTPFLAAEKPPLPEGAMAFETTIYRALDGSLGLAIDSMAGVGAVQAIFDGGAAKECGIQVGDLVYGVNGVVQSRDKELLRALHVLRSRPTMKLAVLRPPLRTLLVGYVYAQTREDGKHVDYGACEMTVRSDRTLTITPLEERAAAPPCTFRLQRASEISILRQQVLSVANAAAAFHDTLATDPGKKTRRVSIDDSIQAAGALGGVGVASPTQSKDPASPGAEHKLPAESETPSLLQLRFDTTTLLELYAPMPAELESWEALFRSLILGERPPPPDPPALCDKAHVCARITEAPAYWPYSGVSGSCDACGAKDLATAFDSHFHCRACNFDLCSACKQVRDKAASLVLPPMTTTDSWKAVRWEAGAWDNTGMSPDVLFTTRLMESAPPPSELKPLPSELLEAMAQARAEAEATTDTVEPEEPLKPAEEAPAAETHEPIKPEARKQRSPEELAKAAEIFKNVLGASVEPIGAATPTPMAKVRSPVRSPDKPPHRPPQGGRAARKGWSPFRWRKPKEAPSSPAGRSSGSLSLIGAPPGRAGVASPQPFALHRPASPERVAAAAREAAEAAAAACTTVATEQAEAQAAAAAAAAAAARVANAAAAAATAAAAEYQA